MVNKADGATSSIVAVEIDEGELRKAKANCNPLATPGTRIEWVCGDFFETYRSLKKRQFDVVLGNPPFIRFQYFDEPIRELAFELMRTAGYRPTKLANAWVAFVELSIELLNDGGRLAMVVPAELLQVNYAAELRNRLAAYFDHITLLAFNKLVFPEIQREVVLLLAEGKRAVAGVESDIHTVEFEDGASLFTPDALNSAVSHAPVKHARPGMKWTSLFLSEKAFGALDEAERSQGLSPLGQLASVDVGIVTGRNSFFMLPAELRREIAASRFTVPAIGRTAALKSILFGKTDFDEYETHYPAYVLDLRGAPLAKLPDKLRRYLEHGERHNINKGYKCRIRARWFDVPSIYVPDAFMFRQIHSFPLLVVNAARATSTDTIHRVRLNAGVDAKVLAATCFNSLTLAWAEVCGWSYGGGVLELEPREAEELPVPYSNGQSIVDADKVDELLRRGRHLDAMDYVDRTVLKDGLGFSARDISYIREAWDTLRDRRRNRR